MSETNSQFDIPVVLIMFKRAEKSTLIMSQISRVRPRKIYLIGDGPRNSSEAVEVQRCRQAVEDKITWPCEVIKNYADENRGVYNNIAGGAMWVFEREEKAIFLEDDNMPELSFFSFCDEILHRYEHDTRVLWICGTNYLKEYNFSNGASYGFTQNMMPCGWASWADKFMKFYDGDLKLWKDACVKKAIASLKYYDVLKKQDMNNWDMEIEHLKRFGRFASWDYQMSFSIRVHNLLGIVPKYNQITNIGVDELSIHGGTSFENEMTQRFCGLPTKPLEFPLSHPKCILPEQDYEEKVARIISLSWKMRIKSRVSSFLKKIFKIDPFDSFTQTMKSWLMCNGK